MPHVFKLPALEHSKVIDTDVAVRLPADFGPANTEGADPAGSRAVTAVQLVALCRPATLTFGSTINTDAYEAVVYDVTLTGNATLAKPSNLSDGLRMVWRIKQDATGGRELTLNSVFRIPATSNLSSPLNSGSFVAANAVTLLEGVYNAEDDKIDIVSGQGALFSAVLAAIASLSPSDGDLLQFVSGAWANRTPSQVKTSLALSNVDNTADSAKPVSTAQAIADSSVASSAATDATSKANAAQAAAAADATTKANAAQSAAAADATTKANAAQSAAAADATTKANAAQAAAIAASISTGYLDTDVTLAANSDSKLATQKAVKAFVSGLVSGLLKMQGDLSCSSNPNYPTGTKGDAYYVSSAGKVGGGGSGKVVAVGDMIVCKANNAGGTEGSVGTSWFVLEGNITDITAAGLTLLRAADAAAQRTALSLVVGTNVMAQGFASQAEAEAGAATDKPMNALRVAQAIAALAPSGGGGGVNTLSMIFVSVAQGSDITGDGSIGNPFNSFDAAYSTLSSRGDSCIYLAQGDYTFTVNTAISSALRCVVGQGMGSSVGNYVTRLTINASAPSMFVTNQNGDSGINVDLEVHNMCVVVNSHGAHVTCNETGGTYTAGNAGSVNLRGNCVFSVLACGGGDNASSDGSVVAGNGGTITLVGPMTLANDGLIINYGGGGYSAGSPAMGGSILAIGVDLRAGTIDYTGGTGASPGTLTAARCDIGSAVTVTSDKGGNSTGW